MATSLLERKEVLGQLDTLAINDIVNLWTSASGLPSQTFRSVMVDALPEIVDPYAATAGNLGAVWYDESAPELPYRAKPSVLPPRQQLLASADWALGASGDVALGRLAEVAQKAIWGTGRRTIADNAKSERGARFERVASGKCCAFCAMLVTRGAVYLESTVSFQAHGNCRCGAQEVRPGRSYEPPSYYERYEDAYLAASRKASGTQAILAEMRTILGTH